MKKKVFSLMMTLLLAFIGVAKADVVTIGEGTGTTYYFPIDNYFNYSCTEQIYLASEIGTAGTINSISFYYNYGTAYTANNVTMYMKNVSRSEFASTADCEPLSASDIVWTGSIAPTEAGWYTFTLTTPFQYDGTSNLLVAFYDGTSGYPGTSYTWRQTTSPNSAYMALRYYSDSTNPDPYNLASYTGSKQWYTYRANAQIDITPGGGTGAGEQIFAVQDGNVVDTVFVGPRPNGAWMEPFKFQIRNTGAATTITNLDWTPEEYFSLVAPELPVQIGHDEDIDVLLNTGESSNTDWQMVAIYGTGRTAAIWNINVEPYNPAIPDVVEMAYDLGTVTPGFSYQGIPSQITPTELHNDYTLPFPEIEEGVDAVYKFTVDNDVIISANVDENDENGKVALYTEDFYGEGGPMATNNYTGLSAAGGGSAAAPFEVQIGEGTSTTGYFPYYTLYNYSIATNLFTAAELAEAGVTTAPFTSLSWYATNSISQDQNGITIWMANVTDTEVSTTSPLATGMTKVYTGSLTQPTPTGWIECVFNEGSFAWDGSSNVLILCQRNNGSWTSSISWQAHNPGFYAQSYNYTDGSAYNVETTTYTMSRSNTIRPNVIMKGGNRGDRAGRELITIGEGTATTNVYPTQATYNYCFNEMIYPAASIGMAGTINSIGFHYNGASELSRNVVVYMKNVTRSAFESTTDWEAVTASDMVYTGTLTSPAVDQWITLNLDTPFYYDGTSNLLIAFDDNTGSWSSRYWYYTTGADNCCMTYYNDGTNPDPYNPPTASGRHTTLPNLQLDITAGGGGAAGETGVCAGPVITNLGLTPGTYYLVASATQADYTVYINVDNMPCPAIEAEGFAFNPQPADDEDEVEPASVTLRWMVPEYATAWRLIFGTTYHPEVGHPQTIMYPEDGSFTNDMASSYTVRNLWNNTNYFWRVEFNNDGCPDGVSSPVWGFTTHLNIPQNLTAVDETVFNDETITLNWNAVVDRTYRMYFVYRDGVKIGQTQVNNIGNTTYTDGPLPYNMAGYTYYVTAIYDEGESAASNTVNVKVSGRGNVDGHVYEQDGTTGIANATVTMIGQDEFGDNHTYNFTTNGQGYYSGAVYAGTYNGQASCDGYQTIDEPIQGNPIDITYNQTTTPVDYMLDENFDPVCAVIAEYYPDSLDPQSPYVKVYWGCGLPGSEIIEDFETGDFSMFDWQIDPTYPWSITTTNPYEGTYCMKSGGAGVANVVSNMTVTVEIPADGLMSFFGKISCENSWDYGYFYIDGVQKGSFTGAGNWIEKTYDVTAGPHTFQWRYTKDSSVNSNDDCFYVDYINFYKQPEPPVPGMTYDFEDGTMQGWTSVDADGDGYGWYMGSEIMTGQTGNNGSQDFVLSQSYYGGMVLYPDNYLVSPQVALGGIVRFYACAQDASYAAEHFGLAVSTTNTNPSSFTMIQEWTMTAKGAGSQVMKDGAADVNMTGMSRDGNTRVQGTWYEYTVDLSAYMGQTGYVAIRHFNCSDMFYLNVDDITIGEPGAKSGENTRRFSHYRVYRTDCYNDGPYTLYDPAAGEFGNTVILSCELHDTIYIDVSWPDAAPGVYKWGVGCVYVGNRGEEIAGPIHWAQPTAGNAKDNRAEFNYGFEGGLDGWTVIDVNTGEGTWIHSDDNLGGYDYTTHAHGGTGFAMCYSFVDYVGSFDTDSYLVSPQKYSIGANSTLSFWADNANDSYPENFSVCVATANNPTAADFTQVWSGSAKDNAAKAENRHDGNRYDNWRSHSINLSAYAGQEVWIAFHDVNYDMYEVWIDDVTITCENAGGGGGNTGNPGDLQEPRESEIVWSNCLDKDMYLAEGDVTVNVLLNSADSPEGIRVAFTNYNEAEQEMYPVEDVILDETGFYAFDSFRKGNYKVNVTFDGYEPIEDSVSIWEPTDLRYVMIEILYGIDNLYVSRTGWAMWDDSHNNPGGGGGGQGGSGDTFTVDLDNSQMPAGWTIIDGGSPSGYGWQIGSTKLGSTGNGHNGSADLILSQSYDNNYGVVYPDNWFISPAVTLGSGSTFSFWACGQDAGYAAEHCGVFVSTTGTNPSDFTLVNEWTLSAKGNGEKAAIRGNRDQGTWRQYTVDLGAYAGAGRYVAIRHFNCSDMFYLDVDDIELTNGAKAEANERHLEYYKVMCTSIDGEPIFNANTIHPFCQVATDALVEGEHYICKVAAMYSTGMSAWEEVEWEYEPCEHWTPIEGLEVTPENEGNHLTWEFAGGGGGGQGGSGDTFTVDFDNSAMPAGWTVIDGGSPSGYGWQLGSVKLGAGNGHNGSADLILSQSYDNNYGVVYPDNWFISPAVTLGSGSTFSFWACGQDAGYAAEHCGVFVSTTGTNPSDFTMVNEWTLSAKNAGGKAAIRGTRDQGTWRQYTVELGQYAGAARYIAIRHFNCSDMFYLDVDDLELSNGAKGTRDEVAFNGYVTDPGAMANGADASWTKNGQGTWGPNANYAAGTGTYYWLADSFTLSAATTISEIEVYGYQTGSSTTSTFTGLYAQIYNGSPMSGGTAVWGDVNTNIMTATAFTNCYRGSDGETTATTRPIMSITAGNLNIDLEAGTYYLVYALTGSSSSGPWGAPHAEPSVGNTGNGLQKTSSGWTTLSDSGSGTPYGCAMKITGNGGGVTPTPVDGVLGFMVFRDGEWLAEILDPNARDYTDIDELGEHEYCVRVIYDGTAVLPSDNYYYAMSCPGCEGIAALCAAGGDIDITYNSLTDEVTVFWNGDTRANVVKYNVYRSSDKVTYEMIGSVASVEGRTYYEYVDAPEAGHYFYQVRAEYSNGCESEPALRLNAHEYNYVEMEVTGVDENDGMAIFPNPTKGNVTIQAAGMQHITVVSVLGQVVYDADIDADEVILNMSQYTAGMYTVRVTTENGIRVERITVIR